MWPGHRLFCGPNAFPVVFPLLSPEELNVALQYLDKPTMTSLGESEPSVSSLTLALQAGFASKDEFEVRVYFVAFVSWQAQSRY